MPNVGLQVRIRVLLSTSVCVTSSCSWIDPIQPVATCPWSEKLYTFDFSTTQRPVLSIATADLRLNRALTTTLRFVQDSPPCHHLCDCRVDGLLSLVRAAIWPLDTKALSFWFLLLNRAGHHAVHDRRTPTVDFPTLYSF